MLFDSILFLAIFPIVLLVYFLIPERIKKYWLLLAGYLFYACYSIKLLLVLLTVTAITYICGRILYGTEKATKTTGKLVVASAFILCFIILAYFKYFDFLANITSDILNLAHLNFSLPEKNIILPVGMSFYTLMGLSYVVDVYRDKSEYEGNVINYALFLSFFPQLPAGPVSKKSELLPEILKSKRFDASRCFEGLLIILWGFFLKLVIAKRLGIFIGTVYGDPTEYTGYYLVMATAFLAVQIYCEIAGYISIAMGASKMLGTELKESFNTPYLSDNVSDFWKNFNASVSGWLKDYIYIPLGGSRKGIIRKYINILITYVIGGLWYGASFGFIAFGLFNGLMHIFGEVLKPVKAKMVNILRINPLSFASRLIRVVFTFCLIDFSFIFFRADRFKDCFVIIKSILKPGNAWVLFNGAMYTLGLSRPEFWLLIICIVLLIVLGMFKKNGVSVRKRIMNQDWWFKCILIILAVFAILTFGIWGQQGATIASIYF